MFKNYTNFMRRIVSSDGEILACHNMYGGYYSPAIDSISYLDPVKTDTISGKLRNYCDINFTREYLELCHELGACIPDNNNRRLTISQTIETNKIARENRTA